MTTLPTTITLADINAQLDALCTKDNPTPKLELSRYCDGVYVAKLGRAKAAGASVNAAASALFALLAVEAAAK